MMFDERSFSTASFDERSWLFLFSVPITDLTGAEKVFVRSVLDVVWSQRTVEQIVSVATLNRLSVLDAATVLQITDAEEVLHSAVQSSRISADLRADQQSALTQQSVLAADCTEDVSLFITNHLPVVAATNTESSIHSTATRDRLFIKTTQQQEFQT